MTELWITQNLKDLLDESGTLVIMENLQDGLITINVNDLVDLFASVNPSYLELSASPLANAGWQKYFDEWKLKGII